MTLKPTIDGVRGMGQRHVGDGDAADRRPAAPCTFTSGCSNLASSFWMASIEPRTSARMIRLSVATSSVLAQAAFGQALLEVVERDARASCRPERLLAALQLPLSRPARGPRRCRRAHRTCRRRCGAIVQTRHVDRRAGPGLFQLLAAGGACRTSPSRGRGRRRTRSRRLPAACPSAPSAWRSRRGPAPARLPGTCRVRGRVGIALYSCSSAVTSSVSSSVVDALAGDGAGADDFDVAAPFAGQQAWPWRAAAAPSARRPPGRSILFIATTIGTSAALAWLIASSVCGMTPSSAATTSTAMSVTFAPRARISVNAS